MPFWKSLLFVSVCSFSSLSFADYPVNVQAEQQFIHQLVLTYHFDPAYLIGLFQHFVPLPEIITKMQTPYEAQPWYIYRQHLLTEQRITAGVNFWRSQQATLQQAATLYKVPIKIVVGILGIETQYGVYKGKYSVFDTLGTLAFCYPPRAAFFTKELAAYLLLSRDNQIDPLSMLGSYAGAIGWPQFMPSSYRNYAVDFSHDKHVDLSQDIPDVIGSVENYLAKNGWQPDQPVAIPARVMGNQFQSFISVKMHEPSRTIAQWAQLGVTPTTPVDPQAKAELFSLPTSPTQTEYWLGLHNFKVIMSYNSSILYAMAVYQLGNQVEAELKQ